MSPLPLLLVGKSQHVMQGSAGYLIWSICYLSVLLGLSAYGVHRYFIIYLFLKHRKRPTLPMSQFESCRR
jgi:hypothetical protein